jgi:hypothetical protein
LKVAYLQPPSPKKKVYHRFGPIPYISNIGRKPNEKIGDLTDWNQALNAGLPRSAKIKPTK